MNNIGSMNNSAAMNNIGSMNNSAAMNNSSTNNNYTNLTTSTPNVTIQNTPPNLSSDTVSTLGVSNYTNTGMNTNMNTGMNAAMNSVNEVNRPLINNTQGTTPLLRGGGRLYRRLSIKKQRKHKKRSMKRKN